MPRTARLYLIGYPHHITQRSVNKDRVFLEEEDYSFMLECLKNASERGMTDIMAYCLMPNHFHLLAIPKTEGALGRCLHHATFRYAQYFNKKYDRTGRLWQNRYYSTIVDAETYMWTVARYIETNPVRAGLVKSPDDWRWSSAGHHLKGIPDEILTRSDWLPESMKDSYKAFLLENSDNDMIRACTLSGRPIGSDSFISRLETLFNRPFRPRPRGRPRKCEK